MRTPVPPLAGRSGGFTLIEALIALVVLSVGLLGIASLQTSAMRYTHTSNVQAQAAVLAQNMIDRIRANPEALDAGLFNDVYLDADPGSSVDCSTDPCNSTELAEYDLQQWYLLLSQTLPSGQGEIECLATPLTSCRPGETDQPFAIIVRWDGFGTGATGTGCDVDNPDDLLCHRVVFVPL
ncbi:MAG TPA: type IV pilus modification protein PilV [Gammaproteobacteria bacterium]|nr:type IV pilus modification protein PilV [Gammaproteobacteria bacterium]